MVQSRRRLKPDQLRIFESLTANHLMPGTTKVAAKETPVLAEERTGRLGVQFKSRSVKEIMTRDSLYCL